MESLKQTEKIIDSLRENIVVSNYPIYSNIFLKLKSAFSKFQAKILRTIQKVLPEIRGSNNKSEESLTDIVEEYETSIFFHNNIKQFLDIRRKEIGTILNILEKSGESSEMTVDFGGDSNGNKCVQVLDFYNFLPSLIEIF